MLAVFQAGYYAVVPSTIVGPVTPELWRKHLEADDLASAYFDSFEDFQKTLLDWDWDSVAVHPHVRLEGSNMKMNDTELVPRVLLFPYREVNV